MSLETRISLKLKEMLVVEISKKNFRDGKTDFTVSWILDAINLCSQHRSYRMGEWANA